jgi:hypothetical protein
LIGVRVEKLDGKGFEKTGRASLPMALFIGGMSMLAASSRETQGQALPRTSSPSLQNGCTPAPSSVATIRVGTLQACDVVGVDATGANSDVFVYLSASNRLRFLK